MLGLELGNSVIMVLVCVGLFCAALYHMYTRIGTIQRTMHHHTLMLAQMASTTKSGDSMTEANDFASKEALETVAENPPHVGQHSLVDVSDDSTSQDTFDDSDSIAEERVQELLEPTDADVGLAPSVSQAPFESIESIDRPTSELRVAELRALVVEKQIMSAAEAKNTSKSELQKLV